MKLSRRAVLTHLGALAASATFHGASHAAEFPSRLVIVLLRGGLDGVSAVAPIGDPHYSRTGRENTHPLPGGLFALHPNLASLRTLYASGELVIFPSVATGYRGRSHSEALSVLYEATGPTIDPQSGWMGRAVELLANSDSRSAITGVASARLVLNLATNSAKLAAFQFLADANEYEQRIPDELRAFAGRMGLQLCETDSVSTAATKYLVERFEEDIDELGCRLALTPGITLSLVEYGGWDTHHVEGAGAGRLATLLAGLDRGITSLRQHSAANWRNTTVLVVSEFGRTVSLNSSGGTDHGTATAAFLIGGNIAGGRLIGDWPGLAGHELLDGDSLRPTLDLRSIIKGLLAAQFDIPRTHLDSVIFPSSFDAPPLGDLLRA